MAEISTGNEYSEQETSLRDQAYQTLLQIKERQLEELKRLQGKPEALELYLADRHTIFDDMIRQEAEKNPLILELHQQSKRDYPSRLEIPQARAKRETTPQQRSELTTQAQRRETLLRIWEQISPDLTAEEQERLRQAMDKQLGTPL